MSTQKVPKWVLLLAAQETGNAGLGSVAGIHVRLGYDLQLSAAAEYASNRQVALANVRTILAAPALSEDGAASLQDLCLELERGATPEQLLVFFDRKYGTIVARNLLVGAAFHRLVRNLACGLSTETLDVESDLTALISIWCMHARRLGVVPPKTEKLTQYVCDLWFPPE